MRHTHSSTLIKELNSEDFNELNSRKVYQVEFVGKGTYKIMRGEFELGTQELNQYLVEYEED